LKEKTNKAKERKVMNRVKYPTEYIFGSSAAAVNLENIVKGLDHSKKTGKSFVAKAARILSKYNKMLNDLVYNEQLDIKERDRLANLYLKEQKSFIEKNDHLPKDVQTHLCTVMTTAKREKLRGAREWEQAVDALLGTF
jgi:hypothetical protein